MTPRTEGRRPGEIERDVEANRAAIDTTLGGSERRLAPARAPDRGRGAPGGRETRPWLGEIVRRNPLPVALVGLGLAWLAFSAWGGRPGPSRAYGYRGAGTHRGARPGPRVGGYGDATVRGPGTAENGGPTTAAATRHTGARDETYDLVSVPYHALQGAETYQQYARDAERRGNRELAGFCCEVQEEERRRAEWAKRLLARRLG